MELVFYIKFNYLLNYILYILFKLKNNFQCITLHKKKIKVFYWLYTL